MTYILHMLGEGVVSGPADSIPAFNFSPGVAVQVTLDCLLNVQLLHENCCSFRFSGYVD